MASNIEIKAAVADPAALRERIVAVATDGPHVLQQHDTFFGCVDGRLKLRCFDDGTGELIFYRRPDARGPSACEYERSATTDPAALARVLEAAWGVRGEVIKTRKLYFVGRTRVHLDRVAGLGDFMELEVVLASDESAADGVAEAERLMAILGIADADLLEPAYIDLIST